ncbi:MAG: hypothetical protein ACE5IM_03315 [Nitrospinota bacterium]
MNGGTHRVRPPLMALAALSFAAALWGGLARLGWAWRPPVDDWVLAHGPLMIGGFLGTVIGLERAAALDRLWPFAAPLLSGLGALVLMVDFTHPAGPLLIALGSAVFVAATFVIVRRRPALFTWVMGLGALAWLWGNVLWLGNRPISRVALWWGGFLILTICGERLELSRLLSLSRRSRDAFLSAVALFLLGLFLSGVRPDSGPRLAGAGMILLSLWLFRFDVARRTVRQTGLTRHVAVCLLSGFAWLGASGMFVLAYGGMGSGPAHDAFLHALFLGFVFSMIFGHAPIVLPAMLGKEAPYHPGFYAPILLLHASLALRIGGDLGGWLAAARWGGLLNAAAILLFFLTMGAAVRRGRAGEASPSA